MDFNAPNTMRNASAFAELTIKEDRHECLSFFVTVYLLLYIEKTIYFISVF